MMLCGARWLVVRGQALWRGRTCLSGVTVLWLALATGGNAQTVEFAVEAEHRLVPLAEIHPHPQPASAPAVAPDTAIVQRLARVEQEIAAGRFLEADAELAPLLELPGELRAEALVVWAELRRKAGRWGEARLAAEHAVHLAPHQVRAWLLLAELARAAQLRTQAIAYYRAAALVEPPASQANGPEAALRVRAWLDLGVLLEEAGYLLAASEALERFDEAVRGAPSAVQHEPTLVQALEAFPYGALERRLALYRNLVRPAAQATAVETAVRTWPAEPALERLYVLTLMEVERAGEAFDYCRERLVASSETADGSVDFALLPLAVEASRVASKLDGWVGELTAAVEEERHLTLAVQVAARLAAAGEDESAIRLWATLARARPVDPEIAWAHATALLGAGDLVAALDALADHLRAAGTDAALPPARLAAWMARFDLATAFLEQVADIAARPDADAPLYAVLGMTATAAEQGELAEQLFRAGLSAGGETALVRAAWAQSLARHYRWEEALAQAEAALSEEPDFAPAHFVRGLALQALDRFEEAEGALREAYDAQPRDADYALELARHYRRSEQWLAAQRYFQEAWNRDRTRGEVLEELIDSYLAGGKPLVARSVAGEADAAGVAEDVRHRIRIRFQFLDAWGSAAHLQALRDHQAAFPSDDRGAIALAILLYETGAGEEADALVGRLAFQAPKDERYFELRLHRSLRRFEIDAAIALLQEEVRRYPRRPALWRSLANAYLLAFRLEDARGALERVKIMSTAGEERVAAGLQLVDLARLLQGVDAALQLLDALAAGEPDLSVWPRARIRLLLAADRHAAAVELARARLEAATALYEQQSADLQAATQALSAADDETARVRQVRVVQQLQEELGQTVRGLYERRGEFAQTAIQAGQAEVLLPLARAWLSEQPGQWLLQVWLIEGLLAVGDVDAATEQVGELVPRTTEDVLQALIWRGRCLAKQGRGEEAANDLLELLNEPFSAENALLRAQLRREAVRLLMEQEAFERAHQLAQTWLAADSTGDPTERLELLELAYLTSAGAPERDAPLALLRELHNRQPDHPGWNNDLGYLLADRGENLAEALEMTRRAVIGDPLNAAFLDSLGWVHYKLGEFAAARELLARSVRVDDTESAVVLDHLGDAEFRLGNRAAAQEAWRRALARADAESADSVPDRQAEGVELRAALSQKLAALSEGRQPAVAPVGSVPNKESAQP